MMSDSQVHDTRLNDEWRRDVGTAWPWLIMALVVGCAVAGWMAPLSDPDLPMHLRTAEWIVREGRVPFTEPFSWTRLGAPFYAYSWLAELLYHEAFSAASANGLHAIQAVTGAGAFLTVFVLGRSSRWTPWATLLTALMSFAMWTLFVGAVRPQALLGITVPLAWMAAEWMVRDRWKSGLAVAFAVAVATANVHILFPFTLMPVVRFLVEPSVSWRRVGLFVIANCIGWMLMPYALVLFDALRINFTGNAMIGPTTPVQELQPGFRAVLRSGVAGFDISMAIFFVVLLAPFLIPSRLLTGRERFVYGLTWVGGLFLFGIAVRGLLIWLLASLPLLARLVSAMPLPQQAGTRRVNVFVVAILPLLFGATAWRTGTRGPQVTATQATRQLAVPTSVVLEPLVRWIECHAQPLPGTHAYNVFAYGSYLVYRLPALSYSIDGRNIFPDSVAKAEVFQSARDGEMLTGPWRTAEIAFVPMGHLAARELRGDAAWQLVRVSMPVDTSDTPAELWVKRGWLERHGKSGEYRAGDTVRAPRAVPAPGVCER